MTPIWKFFLLSIFLLFQKSVNSQIDTIFWFAAPEVSASAGDNPIYLRFMTYDNASDITVSLPANGAFLPINLSLPANTVDSINLTPFLASIESPAGNVVSNNGIKITATENISAFYELKAPTNKEIFSLKGNKSIGSNFYTPFQKFWDNAVTAPASFSSIDIVATEDATTVLITPRTAITGHAQNVTFSVLLNEGETYSARDMNVSAATTLAGSIVSSDKPIAVTVFSGALSNSTCANSMGDQITPVDYTGRDYILHGGTSPDDRVYILATQNGTSVTVTNSGTTTSLINWGETYELALSDALNYISSTKPIYVWHVAGYGCELSGAQIPPMFCAGTYSTAFTRTSSDSLGLILYTRTGFEDQFELNGNPALIPSGAFNDVPGTAGNYQMALIHFSIANVPINSYNEVTNSGDIFGLGVLGGNNGTGSGYAYFSEFNSYPFINAGIDDTICANTTIDLNGLVGGGSVTGNWSGTGFGSFSNPTSDLLNTYIPNALDTIISPIQLILTSTGPCPVIRDTMTLVVEPAPIVNASADQTLCVNNSIVELNGNVAGGATTGVWSSLGTGDFVPDSVTLNAEYIPSPADIAFGSVQLVLTSTNFGSCVVETDTMEVTFTVAATVDAGTDTIFVCKNDPLVTLSGSVSGVTSTGKWTSSGTGVFAPDNLTLNATYNPSPADLLAGSIWLTLQSTSNGNCVPEFDSLIVVFTDSPIVDAGTNTLTCTNDAAIELNGSISGATTTGSWSGGAGTYSTDNTDLNATYTPTAGEISAGTLFLTLTSTNNGGCLAVNDNVQINFIAPPFANFNFTEECLYDATVFTDFSLPGYGTINNWEWNFGDGGNSSSQNNTHNYSAAGTYDVQLIVTSDAGCSDTVVQQVEAFEVPVADFSFSSSCPNNQIIVDFTDESTSVNDPINFWYYDFGGQGTSAVENPTQLFTANGDYSIVHIVGTVNGCYDTTVQQLNVPSLPNAGFSYNTDNGLNIGAVFNFISTATNTTGYLWEFGNSQTSNDQNPSSTYFSNGTYTITQYAYGSLGCVDSTSQTITINTVTTEINALIPNAISPNGDNKNDIWKLEFIQLLYSDASVSIFNQWGQQIFESVGYDIPWDGSYQNSGELVPDGTYYYIIDLNAAGDESDIYKGTILVLKSKN